MKNKQIQMNTTIAEDFRYLLNELKKSRKIYVFTEESTYDTAKRKFGKDKEAKFFFIVPHQGIKGFLEEKQGWGIYTVRNYLRTRGSGNSQELPKTDFIIAFVKRYFNSMSEQFFFANYLIQKRNWISFLLDSPGIKTEYRIQTDINIDNKLNGVEEFVKYEDYIKNGNYINASKFIHLNTTEKLEDWVKTFFEIWIKKTSINKGWIHNNLGGKNRNRFTKEQDDKKGEFDDLVNLFEHEYGKKASETIHKYFNGFSKEKVNLFLIPLNLN